MHHHHSYSPVLYLLLDLLRTHLNWYSSDLQQSSKPLAGCEILFAEQFWFMQENNICHGYYIDTALFFEFNGRLAYLWKLLRLGLLLVSQTVVLALLEGGWITDVSLLQDRGYTSQREHSAGLLIKHIRPNLIATLPPLSLLRNCPIFATAACLCITQYHLISENPPQWVVSRGARVSSLGPILIRPIILRLMLL